MFKLTCNIEIKGAKTWTFDKVASVEIDRDSDTLTDTCAVTMPKKIKWQGVPDIPVKRGDKISVSLGYDGDNVVAFRGYVTTIGVKTPIVINCEDDMFILKQKPAVKKAYKSVGLQTLLADQATGYKIMVCGEQNIGAYRVTVSTVAELLNKLKEQGVRSFFRYESNGTPVLYCGVLFDNQGTRVQVYNNRKNMISDDSLEMQNAADVKLKVKAVSLDPKNKKTKIEVGDADGEVRTLHTYNKTAKELKAWAEQELKRLKRDGLTGSFEAFGGVLVDKIDTIGIILDDVRRGIYQVKKNTITYSVDGFRQNIEIGDRIDGNNIKKQ
jgi:hypothetical protein bfra3_07012